MTVLLPPPRSLYKAAYRLNPAIDLDVDILAVKRAAGASTKEEWESGTLTLATADSRGFVTVAEDGTKEIFKSPGVAADATRLYKFYSSQDYGELLWLDFFPNPAVFGPGGFILSAIDLVLKRADGGAIIAGVTVRDPYTIHVTRFDENWNREALTAPIKLSTGTFNGSVTVNLRDNGRLVRIAPGRSRTRTASGRTSAGAERTADVVVENDRKTSHIEVNNGFSIGIEGRMLTGSGAVQPALGMLQEGVHSRFDRNNFWRSASDRSHGPYSPDIEGASPLVTTTIPGSGFMTTGAVPGYGSKDTAALTGASINGQWGITQQPLAPHKIVITQTWGEPYNQPWHILRAVKYRTSGTVLKVLDLGAAPAGEVHFRADAAGPSGTNVTYTARGSTDNATWTALGTIEDGKVWTVAVTRYRYYEITATLTASADLLNTPILNAMFVTERTVYGVFKYARDFDSSTSIDPTSGQSSIGELKLSLLRLGRGDPRDIITKIATEHSLASVEAWVYVRETVTGKRHFLNLYRLEDREPGLGEEEFTFVSGMDRLKAHVPPKKETDQYPSDGTEATVLTHTYNAGTKELTIDVSGTPFAAKNIVGWRFEGRSGVLSGLVFFIAATPVPDSNTFTIVLQDNAQEVTNGDKFKLFSGMTTRVEVNYSGQDFAVVYSNLLTTQAEVPQRYRGVLPATTGRTTPGRLTGEGRAALEPLQDIALHIGGALAWVRGRISYIDIYGPKASVETWNESDYSTLKPSVGAGRRMPSVVAKYGYDYVAKTFPFEATFDDANALLAMGRANLFDVTNLSDSFCLWNDSAEAKHAAEKFLRAWATGVRIWHVSLVIPRPWRNEGDCVTLSTDQYTDRKPMFSGDGLVDQGSPIRGRVSAVGVIVGKNLWGTEFDVAILGLDNVTPAGADGSNDGEGAALVCPTISLSEIPHGFLAADKLRTRRILILFTKPTSPYYANMEFQVLSNTVGDSNAYSGTAIDSPGGFIAHPGVTYTVTPYVVTHSGKKTAGTAVALGTTADTGLGPTRIILPVGADKWAVI